MQLRVLNFLFAQEFINDVLANIETLWFKFEFSVDVDNPLQKKCSLSVFDFCLDLLKIIWWVYFVFFFLLEQIFVNSLSEFRHIAWVSVIKLIWKGHCFQLSFFLSSASFFENFLDIFCVICYFLFLQNIWSFGSLRFTLNLSNSTLKLINSFVLFVIGFLICFCVFLWYLFWCLDWCSRNGWHQL